jgi:hypothetical protein
VDQPGLLVASVATLASLLPGLAVAYLLARREFRGRALLAARSTRRGSGTGRELPGGTILHHGGSASGVQAPHGVGLGEPLK